MEKRHGHHPFRHPDVAQATYLYREAEMPTVGVAEVKANAGMQGKWGSQALDAVMVGEACRWLW